MEKKLIEDFCHPSSQHLKSQYCPKFINKNKFIYKAEQDLGIQCRSLEFKFVIFEDKLYFSFGKISVLVTLQFW